MKPTIVHANSTKAGFLGRIAARLAGVPYVVFTAHGLVLGEEFKGLKRLGLLFAERIGGLLSDGIITVSEDDRQLALRHGLASESRVVRIHNGVESARSVSLMGGNALRSRFGPGCLLIGTVANFYPTKGLEYLLTAAKYVSREMPAARFIIVGDGELRKPLEAIRNDLGLESKVVFLGYQTEVDGILAELDLFVLSSVKEGMPFALLEAMAHGLPIVATAVGGVAEALDAGRAGVLVPPRNSERLAEAVLELLRNRDRAKEFGKAAFERMMSEFRIDGMISATEGVYRGLLEERPRALRLFDGGPQGWRKRLVDVLFAGVGFLLTTPLWVAIALAIKLEDGGPIFYSQDRVGMNGRVFRLRKFRSMVSDAERLIGPVWAESGDRRVTRVGRILRATALDELPQLWNILRGDMSVVGPRPERPEFVRQFSDVISGYEKRGHLRPGLTGLAQVFGRYDSPPRHKLRYDLLYAKRGNLWLDVRLIGLSFWITFRGRWEDRRRKV
jgi:lipopolysaccharide/colanic/teichoic acid biosynthesis glycosyltransferase/glycosyltransferase involved in cell wall biosynthesis